MKTTGHTEERELVRRAVKGDRDAFEELICRYITRVKLYLMQQVRDSETADDLKGKRRPTQASASNQALQRTWINHAAERRNVRHRSFA